MGSLDSSRLLLFLDPSPFHQAFYRAISIFPPLPRRRGVAFTPITKVDTSNQEIMQVELEMIGYFGFKMGKHPIPICSRWYPSQPGTNPVHMRVDGKAVVLHTYGDDASCSLRPYAWEREDASSFVNVRMCSSDRR